MEALDLTFITENGRFVHRVGAIIIRDGKVLMVKNELAPYYYSLGGRIKLNETSEEAVCREVYEETGMRFEVERLAFVHENFFVEEVTGELFHEVAIYYLMKDNGASDLICNSHGDFGKEQLAWIPLQEIGDYYLYPTFFKTKLQDMPNDVEHIVTKEY